MVHDSSRDANAAGFGQLLQARRDVNSIAVAVAVLDDYVADMHADPDVDALDDWQLAVPLGHAALEGGRTLHRINQACELSEKAISHQLEDAAVALLDLRLEQLLAMRP